MSSQASITLSLQQTQAAVNRNIYGHFAEHLGKCIYGGIWVGEHSKIPHDQGIRLDTVEALRGLELPVLRWPGGCFADAYHWQDGVGPRQQRPTRWNTWWGQQESNAFGTDEFIRFCRLIGAEPYLCVNVGSGTAEEARSWLEYCNARQETSLSRRRAANGNPEPFNIRYWGIGNENWGCGGKMTPEHYADLYRQFATYMRTTDPKITLIACGSSFPDWDWDERFLAAMKGAEDLVDAVALHYYANLGVPCVEFTDKQYYQVLSAVEIMDAHVTRAARACRAHSTDRRRIKLVMDEWGTWYREATNQRGLRQESTMLDAVFTAMAFHMFHRHAAELVMANMAQTANVLQALVLTEGPKLCVSPTYWVYHLVKPHRDGLVVPTTLHGPALTLEDGKTVPLCSAAATLKGGTLCLSLVNADLNEACQVRATLDDTESVRVKSARILTSPEVRSHNTPQDPEAVAPGDFAAVADGKMVTANLPPCSVAVIEMALV